MFMPLLDSVSPALLLVWIIILFQRMTGLSCQTVDWKQIWSGSAIEPVGLLNRHRTGRPSGWTIDFVNWVAGLGLDLSLSKILSAKMGHGFRLKLGEWATAWATQQTSTLWASRPYKEIFIPHVIQIWDWLRKIRISWLCYLCLM